MVREISPGLCDVRHPRLRRVDRIGGNEVTTWDFLGCAGEDSNLRPAA
jgi:hypothetical protein